jgi:hypothetical protein
VGGDRRAVYGIAHGAYGMEQGAWGMEQRKSSLKFESRNPKQYQMTKILKSKLNFISDPSAYITVWKIEKFDIRICFGLRVSNFGFFDLI